MNAAGLRKAFENAFEYVVPWLVLALLLTYSYADLFQHPFGFWWSSPDGTISKVFVNEREPTLHIGDKLVRVGSTDLEAFQSDLRRDLLGGAKAGEFIPITVQRENQLITVDWQIPGPNPGEMHDQLTGTWFLAYFFWIAGVITVLVMRPRDERWFLMTAFNFLTAIWLVAGSGLSFFHIWMSALVLRTAIWLSVPVNLHLHWVFPRPLGRIPPWVRWSAYGVFGVIAVAQWLQWVPPGLYFLGFLLGAAGSLILLWVHYVRQPDVHRDLGVAGIAIVLAIVPSIVAGLLAMIKGSMPPIAAAALLSFPILPFAYLYAAYRRHLGGLEVRVNRLISIYAFLIVVGAIIVPLLVFIDQLPLFSPDQTLITGVIASMLVTALSLWGFPIFQRHIERRWLGIALPSKELQQTYSSHITSSSSFASLARLLVDEIMQSLLVRQFVCFIQENGSPRVLIQTGVMDEEIPTRPLLTLFRPMTKQPPTRPPFQDARYAWVRLVLPLKAQDDLLGFWLFGRRDPDDVYSSAEIPILQSFADQTAVALSNIMQTERLRGMYQADINRYEQERLSLARDLHDSVLSELAGMLMNADMATLPKSFQEGYQALTQRLREIVSDLRPPMLSYGLKPAIEELADKLMERSKDNVDIIVELEAKDDRYPPDREQHIFRIVQEACENAVRHSKGKTIRISGQLQADKVELSVEDDGRGFALGKANIEFNDLINERHFGLAGMFERAELIHAQIQLSSAPDSGTHMVVRWDNVPRQSGEAQGREEFSS